MPEPRVDPADVLEWRSRWGNETVFVVSFDYLSIAERKNPIGAIEAFRQAFEGSTAPVRLVVKSINGEQRPGDVDRVVVACSGDERIELLDEHLDDRRHHALIAAADVLVSLHRSEGLGLQPAIAMWLDTAVLATRYSGVVDFLDDECAAMVDADLVGVTNGQGIYPETALWADPDLAQAAALMRRLAADPAERDQLARHARARIEGQPTVAEFGEAYAAVLRTDGAGYRPGGAGEPFFDGLDVARRSGVVERIRRGIRFGRRDIAWPETARH